MFYVSESKISKAKQHSEPSTHNITSYIFSPLLRNLSFALALDGNNHFCPSFTTTESQSERGSIKYSKVLSELKMWVQFPE